MKLKINKKLIALTLAGVMLSLTGCGAEKENNEVSIINEYNETNYDKDLFKEIGVSDYIIENEDFKNIIAELKELGIKLTSRMSETLGGYIMEELGHIPHEGETIRREGYKFTVTDMEENRIAKVLVRNEEAK